MSESTGVKPKRNWQIFPRRENRANPDSLRIPVRLYSSGMLDIRNDLIEALGNPEIVSLFFEADTKTIGIKPALPDMPFGYNLYKRTARQSISLRGFCAHFGISLSANLELSAFVEDGTLIIPLEEKGKASDRTIPPSPQSAA